MSWVVVVLAIATLLTAVWLGRLEVSVAQAGAVRKTIKGIAAAKVVVSILAFCTFAAAGFEGKAGEQATKARSAERNLAELQVRVLSHAEHSVAGQVLAQALNTTGVHAASVSTLMQKYSMVAPYLSGRPALVTTSGDEPVRLVDASHPADITEAQATDDLRDEETATTRNLLAEDLVDLLFDKKVSEPAKKYLLGLHNPILAELAGAILDPLIAKPLKRGIARIAQHTMRTGGRPAANEVGQIAASLVMAVARRVSAVNNIQDDGSYGVFGATVWDNVRQRMDAAIVAGLNHKPPSVQDAARSMARRFQDFRTAFLIVVPESRARHTTGEEAFKAYIRGNPDYAAIWGYAVIALKPESYERRLEEISVRGMGSKVQELRSLLAISDKEIRAGIANRYGTTLNPQMSDRELAEAIYRAHGAYPLDGFLLYQEATGGDATEAETFYKTDRVEAFVDKYCPANGS